MKQPWLLDIFMMNELVLFNLAEIG